jgi:hypothetical protein
MLCIGMTAGCCPRSAGWRRPSQVCGRRRLDCLGTAARKAVAGSSMRHRPRFARHLSLKRGGCRRTSEPMRPACPPTAGRPQAGLEIDRVPSRSDRDFPIAAASRLAGLPIPQSGTRLGGKKPQTSRTGLRYSLLANARFAISASWLIMKGWTRHSVSAVKFEGSSSPAAPQNDMVENICGIPWGRRRGAARLQTRMRNENS